MGRLLGRRFEWVLPGHGRIHHDSTGNMQDHLRRCAEWMKAQS